MEIKDLQPRQGNVDVVIEVIEKGDIREFEKFGKKGRVCSAKAKDSSGVTILSLWNEQIDQISVGDTVHVTNGYVTEFQGENQLSTGKFGKLEVTKSEEPKVYTNVSQEELKKEIGEEELSEDPVADEEYIG
ncbi:MAG: hypothetical protein ABIC04_03925 [Nanoarchaeota archaeon]